MLASCVCKNKFEDSCFRNLGCHRVAFTESWKLISFIITKWNAWAKLSGDDNGLWMDNTKMAAGEGVLAGTEQLRPSVPRPVAPLLHFSYRSACNYTHLVWNYRHIITLLSTQVYLTCLTMRSTLLLLLMVILASCQCLYEYFLRVLFCVEVGEEWGRTKGFAIPSPRLLTLLTWS